MNTAIIMASVALFALTQPVQAQSAFGSEEKSSIVYEGGKQKYDEKIAKAAIDKAASRIGDLRGTITGGTATDEIVMPEAEQVKFGPSSALKPTAETEILQPHELPPMPMV